MLIVFASFQEIPGKDGKPKRGCTKNFYVQDYNVYYSDNDNLKERRDTQNSTNMGQDKGYDHHSATYNTIMNTAADLDKHKSVVHISNLQAEVMMEKQHRYDDLSKLLGIIDTLLGMQANNGTVKDEWENKTHNFRESDDMKPQEDMSISQEVDIDNVIDNSIYGKMKEKIHNEILDSIDHIRSDISDMRLRHVQTRRYCRKLEEWQKSLLRYIKINMDRNKRMQVYQNGQIQKLRSKLSNETRKWHKSSKHLEVEIFCSQKRNKSNETCKHYGIFPPKVRKTIRDVGMATKERQIPSGTIMSSREPDAETKLRSQWQSTQSRPDEDKNMAISGKSMIEMTKPVATQSSSEIRKPPASIEQIQKRDVDVQLPVQQTSVPISAVKDMFMSLGTSVISWILGKLRIDNPRGK